MFIGIYARFLVHISHINGTTTHTVVFQLFNEELFIVQQIEFIAVKRPFYRIDFNIYYYDYAN